MLTVLRTKQKSFMVQVVFWAIIAAFVGTIFLVWGRGSDSDTNQQAAAVVNGVEIPYDEVQRSYSNLYRIYQNLYGDRFTPAMEKQLGLRQQAFDNLTNQILLLEQAEQQGISVSRDELVKSIAEVPAFQENGVFDKNRYLQVLTYQRLSPEQFEVMQERDLLVEKVREQIRSRASVTEAEIEQEFKATNDKIVLSFLTFAPSLFKDKVEVTEEGLATFFEQNQNNFEIPDQRSISYIKFDPSAGSDSASLTDEEIQRYYDRHMADYDVAEQVKASHILIRVPSDADDATREQKRALAEKILADAKAGKDFAEMARTLSDDAGTAEKGGSLGYFGHGTMVAAFEQAAFTLQPGDFSDVVETPFGFHIIKGEGYIEAGVKPLADVIDEVKTGAMREKVQQIAYEKAIDAFNINRKTGDLQAAASANELEIQTTDLFSRNSEVPGIDDSQPLVAAAFSLEEAKLSRPVTLPSGIYLIKVAQIEPSHIPELSAVRGEVEKAYRTAEADRLAKEAAAEALSSLQEGASLKSVVKQTVGVKIGETDPFPKSFGAFIPKIGSSEELAEAAFKLTPESPLPDSVFAVSGKNVVVRLKEQQPADPADLTDDKRAELRESLLAKQQDELLEKEVETLKASAEILVSPQLQNFLKEG